MPTVESVLEDIGRLSPEDRSRLIEFLLIDAMGEPPNARSDDEWIEELERRRASNENRTPWVPGQPLFRHLKLEG